MECEDVLVVEQMFVNVRPDEADQLPVDDKRVALPLRQFWKLRKAVMSWNGLRGMH